MERRYCALSKKCKSEHVSVRLELTFPAKGHYNESQDISNLHSVLDHPIVFLSQITDKNQNPHFRNIFKEVSSVFSMYHFKRTNRKI